MTARELLKTDTNISEHDFRIVVIRLIAGFENSIKDIRESIAAEQGPKIKDLKSQ